MPLKIPVGFFPTKNAPFRLTFSRSPHLDGHLLQKQKQQCNLAGILAICLVGVASLALAPECLQYDDCDGHGHPEPFWRTWNGGLCQEAS